MNPERLARLKAALDRRQPDLTVVMDQVNKPHNLAAIIRSADAVGVPEVHAVWPTALMRMAAAAAKGSHDWMAVTTHPDLRTCIAGLKARGMQVLATHLDDSAVDFRSIDYTRPTAILLGQEKYGLPPESLALADKRIVIPMNGMVQSLNVSVAAALILYEAQRQRALAGRYEQPQLSGEMRSRLLFQGCHPQLYKRCRLKNLPLPLVGDDGEIQADEQWWQVMRYADGYQPI
jgi:tRNA (guanosine-2'-O-)-methyltransferase